MCNLLLLRSNNVRMVTKLVYSLALGHKKAKKRKLASTQSLVSKGRACLVTFRNTTPSKKQCESANMGQALKSFEEKNGLIRDKGTAPSICLLWSVMRDLCVLLQIIREPEL